MQGSLSVLTALVGPSGGGKTTVSRLAARFWDINRGKITVGGMDVSRIDPEILLSLYSIVFQDVTLFDNTILENIGHSRHPVIICGDFNDTPLSYAYHRLSKGRKDSFKEAGKGFAATFAPLWPLLRIDYILFPKEFSGISHHTPRINLSDHYPVIAETGYND